MINDGSCSMYSICWGSNLISAYVEIWQVTCDCNERKTTPIRTEGQNMYVDIFPMNCNKNNILHLFVDFTCIPAIFSTVETGCRPKIQIVIDNICQKEYAFLFCLFGHEYYNKLIYNDNILL